MKVPYLMKKGAEASLYVVYWHERKVVLKRRLPKKYRPSKLDDEIRFYRTIHEPQLMHEAKKAGVPTPTIFMVDVKNTTIIMDFVDGEQVKRLLSEASATTRQELCMEIGRLIGKLHDSGIIHGDLTTSNMIRNPEGKIVFVDFGLGEKSKELEIRGVDLHLMKRALQSTHFRFAQECFGSVMKGYSGVLGAETTRTVLEKIVEIEKRGRYVAERRMEA
ncbi:MAG TPA: KEOPS complex kinase/ATPase Bud32 [Candidatus Acidoferrum sp.]|nr:KEOPS complex kinase/ATPase Bud32 [Candidatus Acidoferrum sp.]